MMMLNAEASADSIAALLSLLGLGATGAIVILFLIIDLWIAIWVYRDAKKNFHNPVLWAFITLLSPWYLGVIVYLVLKELRALKSNNNEN